MLRLRTLLTLMLGPLLAIAVSGLILEHCRSYWELMRSLEVGTSSAVEAEIRLAEPHAVRRVVLGSSLALTDVDERLLDRLLGEPEGSTINLGIKGEPAAVSVMLTPKVVRLAPDVVVFVVHTENLCHWGPWSDFDAGRGRGVPPSTVYDLSVAWRIFPLRSFLVDRDYHLAGALGESCLLVRHRLDLRYLASKLLLHRGALPQARDPKLVPRLGERAFRRDLEAARRELQFPADGPNSRALCYVATVLTGAGIRLVVVVAPDHPGIRDAAHPPAFDRLLSRLQRQCSLDIIPRKFFRDFRDADFIDHHHLSRDGREDFTTAVAAYLKTPD